MLGEVVVAQSSTPAVAAGFAADAGSEGGGGAEWQTVTRGKAKAGGTKKTTMRVRPSVAEGGDGPQQSRVASPLRVRLVKLRYVLFYYIII